VIEQWTAKWPSITNAVSRIVQNHGGLSYTFVGRVGDLPSSLVTFCMRPHQLSKGGWSLRVFSSLTCFFFTFEKISIFPEHVIYSLLWKAFSVTSIFFRWNRFSAYTQRSRCILARNHRQNFARTLQAIRCMRTPNILIWWKSRQNPWNFGQNLWTPSQNPWKLEQTPWKYEQAWRSTCFDLKK